MTAVHWSQCLSKHGHFKWTFTPVSILPGKGTSTYWFKDLDDRWFPQTKQLLHTHVCGEHLDHVSFIAHVLQWLAHMQPYFCSRMKMNSVDCCPVLLNIMYVDVQKHQFYQHCLLQTACIAWFICFRLYCQTLCLGDLLSGYIMQTWMVFFTALCYCLAAQFSITLQN